MPKVPLEGIRIIDLGRIYAGPLATRLLADLGAEVIRVEPPWGRGELPGPGPDYPDGEPGERPYNRLAFYNELNRNKYAICLDLAKAEGREVFLRLVRVSDVVAENFSPRVLENLRLDYPHLQEVRSDIILVSISAYGRTGPYRNYIGFGPQVEALAGHLKLVGYPDELGAGVAYADAAAGALAAFATLLALRYRKLTGQGVHLDLSMLEALSFLLAGELLDWTISGRRPEPRGNSHPHQAPHGCYRCRGEDRWVVIAVSGEKEWRALCQAMGRPELAEDGRFSTSFQRKQHEEELNQLLEEWTRVHDPGEVMWLLQGAGVACGVVQNPAELLSDPHLRERGFLEEVTHPEAGTHPHPGAPWKLGDTRPRLRPAPCFAEHNQYVLRGLLGMSSEELELLQKRKVIASSPLRLE